uniref:Ribosome-binding factor A n=1 Tax=Hanusia phi TaxID=3032 RepID=A0A7S0E062_9CRYP|eukprot:761551-Hanusia_phi.AAC.4
MKFFRAFAFLAGFLATATSFSLSGLSTLQVRKSTASCLTDKKLARESRPALSSLNMVFRRVPAGRSQGYAADKRSGRLGKIVLTELVQILRNPFCIKVTGGELNLDVISMVTVVEVEMVGDNTIAKVLVSAMGTDAEKRQAVKWLNDHSKALRFSLAQRMKHHKKVPELRFTAAALPEAMSVMSLLDQIREEREAKEATKMSAEEQAVKEVSEGMERELKVMGSEDDKALFAGSQSVSN